MRQRTRPHQLVLQVRHLAGAKDPVRRVHGDIGELGRDGDDLVACGPQRVEGRPVVDRGARARY